jgi:hypothetical protein
MFKPARAALSARRPPGKAYEPPPPATHLAATLASLGMRSLRSRHHFMGSSDLLMGGSARYRSSSSASGPELCTPTSTAHPR